MMGRNAVTPIDVYLVLEGETEQRYNGIVVDFAKRLDFYYNGKRVDMKNRVPIEYQFEDRHGIAFSNDKEIIFFESNGNTKYFLKRLSQQLEREYI